jgi:hypothetical protein
MIKHLFPQFFMTASNFPLGPSFNLYDREAHIRSSIRMHRRIPLDHRRGFAIKPRSYYNLGNMSVPLPYPVPSELSILRPSDDPKEFVLCENDGLIEVLLKFNISERKGLGVRSKARRLKLLYRVQTESFRDFLEASLRGMNQKQGLPYSIENLVNKFSGSINGERFSVFIRKEDFGNLSHITDDDFFKTVLSKIVWSYHEQCLNLPWSDPLRQLIENSYIKFDKKQFSNTAGLHVVEASRDLGKIKGPSNPVIIDPDPIQPDDSRGRRFVKPVDPNAVPTVPTPPNLSNTPPMFSAFNQLPLSLTLIENTSDLAVSNFTVTVADFQDLFSSELNPGFIAAQTDPTTISPSVQQAATKIPAKRGRGRPKKSAAQQLMEATTPELIAQQAVEEARLALEQAEKAKADKTRVLSKAKESLAAEQKAKDAYEAWARITEPGPEKDLARQAYDEASKQLFNVIASLGKDIEGLEPKEEGIASEASTEGQQPTEAQGGLESGKKRAAKSALDASTESIADGTQSRKVAPPTPYVFPPGGQDGGTPLTYGFAGNNGLTAPTTALPELLQYNVVIESRQTFFDTVDPSVLPLPRVLPYHFNFFEDSFTFSRMHVKADYLAAYLHEKVFQHVFQFHSPRIVYNSLDISSYERKIWQGNDLWTKSTPMNLLETREYPFKSVTVGRSRTDYINVAANLIFTANFSEETSSIYKSNRFVTCSCIQSTAELADPEMRYRIEALEQGFGSEIVLSHFPRVVLKPVFRRGTVVEASNKLLFRGLASNSANFDNLP